MLPKRNVLLAAAVIALGLTHSAAVAADTELTRATIKGIEGVYVLIEAIHRDAQKEGLFESTLQTDVELRLRQGGVRVLTSAERAATPGSPDLYLQISTLKSSSSAGLYVYNVSLDLNQSVRLERDPGTRAYGAKTWNATGVIGIVGASRLSSSIREVVRDMADSFVNAYLAVNPKQ